MLTIIIFVSYNKSIIAIAREWTDDEVVKVFINHMKELHYDNKTIEHSLQIFDVNKMRDILKVASHSDVPNYNNTILNRFIELQVNSIVRAEEGFVSLIENLAHGISNINPMQPIVNSLFK